MDFQIPFWFIVVLVVIKVTKLLMGMRWSEPPTGETDWDDPIPTGTHSPSGTNRLEPRGKITLTSAALRLRTDLMRGATNATLSDATLLSKRIDEMVAKSPEQFDAFLKNSEVKKHIVTTFDMELPEFKYLVLRSLDGERHGDVDEAESDQARARGIQLVIGGWAGKEDILRFGQRNVGRLSHLSCRYASRTNRPRGISASEEGRMTARLSDSVRFLALVLLLLLSSCAQQQSLQQGAPPAQEATNELMAAIEQLDAETRIVCAREEYKPLFVHTACDPGDITVEQLADGSKLTPNDKPLFWKIHSEGHVIATKLATALRSYGGTRGAEVALAAEQADHLIEKNASALYDGTTNWGDYNERRKEINEMLLNEIDRIDPSPNDSQITLPA